MPSSIEHEYIVPFEPKTGRKLQATLVEINEKHVFLNEHK